MNRRQRTGLGDLVTNVKTVRQDGSMHEHVVVESEPLVLAPELRRPDQYEVFNDRGTAA